VVSPILVRPVREQLEHDRIVRLLQAKSRRRFDAAANPGNEQNAPVKVGTGSVFPDVLLFAQDRGRRLQAVIEVETGESVNHLEALSQWAPLSRLRVDFHLYVPASMVDVARRLCEDNQVNVNEVWSYHLVGDQFRFTLMHRARESASAARPARRPAAEGKRPSVSPSSRPAPGRVSGGAASAKVKGAKNAVSSPKAAQRPPKGGRAAKPARKAGSASAAGVKRPQKRR
jgi:hypothetical protein